MEVPTLVPMRVTLFGKRTLVKYRCPCKKRGRDRHAQRECPVKTDRDEATMQWQRQRQSRNVKDPG